MGCGFGLGLLAPRSGSRDSGFIGGLRLGHAGAKGLVVNRMVVSLVSHHAASGVLVVWTTDDAVPGGRRAVCSKVDSARRRAHTRVLLHVV